MQADFHMYINGLWIALGVLWLAGALTAKKAGGRVQAPASRLFHLVIVALAFTLLFKPETGAGFLGMRFVPESVANSSAGLALVIGGIGLAAFARLRLGPNWSAIVSIKEDHELIRSGPYRWVRHPIYSGFLLAMLGTAIATGEWRCLIGCALGLAGFWFKARMEEEFLVEQFGERYRAYKGEVKALVPFIL